MAFFRSAALMFLVTALCGCAGLPEDLVDPPPTRARIDSPKYDAVFEAAVETLRERLFVVDRKDRRNGVVTTHPRVAASGLEPWLGEPATAHQVRQSTLNLQRRTVTVSMVPTDARAAGYRFEVNVLVERRNHPPRTLSELNITRSGGQGTGRRDRRTIETERGPIKSTWRPVGRDPYFEQSLADQILRRAGLAPVSGGDEPG